MKQIIKFLKESERRERRWKALIKLLFNPYLSPKSKKALLEYCTLSILLLVLLLTIVQAAPTLVTIQDQQGRTITQLVKVQVIGCTIRAYNSSHFILEMEKSCILKVSLYNITVWQGSLEPNNSYVVKAAVVEMKIKSPSRDIPITVRLLGTDKEWHLYGEKEYTIYPVPAATYNKSLPGKSFTIYYNGGELRFVKEFATSPY